MHSILKILVVVVFSFSGILCDDAGAEDYQINFFNSAFIPTSLTIEAGDSVTWNWVSGSHQLNSGFPGGTPGTPDEPGALFSATIDPQNPTFSHTFTEMGITIGFYDANNPAQIGSITILDDTLTFEVDVVDNSYIPQIIEIFEGDRVRWIHEPMEMLHTVTSGMPGGAPGTIEEAGALFDEESSDLNPIFEYTFDNAMELPYFCIPHVAFGMVGQVIIQDRFIRGDSDRNGVLGIGDAIFSLGFLFQGAATPNCLDALDVSDDGQVDIADPVSLLGYLFSSTAAPAAPFPTEGPDRTVDSLLCHP
ncbi:MAG: plastocyanin/azurin family copper-binding protein [Planctomycetota bacterium]|nr:plastocyanin/azurin family copper-binding protein [Planctomycetota bacterium]